MRALLEEVEVVIEKKHFVDFSVHIYTSGLVEILWSLELKQIEKCHLQEITKILLEVGEGKKMLVYFSTHDLLTISKEARIYGGTDAAHKYTIANAVLTDSLATKLIFNFFMRVNRPITPTKSFSKKEDALRWLIQKKLESKN